MELLFSFSFKGKGSTATFLAICFKIPVNIKLPSKTVVLVVMTQDYGDVVESYYQLESEAEAMEILTDHFKMKPETRADHSWIL